MTIAAIVLAAGMSRRFGTNDKLLSPYRGRPLATYAANALSPLGLSAKIVVISNPALRDCFAGFDIVELEDGTGGQSASIHAGLARARQANPDKILITLADMPEVTPDLLQVIIDTATPDQPAAVSNGQRAMPPACFPASYFEQLENLKGDAGARDILKSLPESALVPTPPAMLRDIDRAEDIIQRDKPDV